MFVTKKVGDFEQKQIFTSLQGGNDTVQLIAMENFQKIRQSLQLLIPKKIIQNFVHIWKHEYLCDVIFERP